MIQAQSDQALGGQGDSGTERLRHHRPERIARKLQDADRLLNAAQSIETVCQALVVSQSTDHRWRNQYGGMGAQEARRLEEPEQKNARLKGLLAEAELDKAMRREVAQRSA